MPTGHKTAKGTCANYRERMSECRECDKSDMHYKICFRQKKPYSNREKIMGFE